ncbi:MAG: hypothetical protein SFY92_04960 [Verrucomicrobiae bacterium]|nr:hypothetical protein [Verrucomicrobiae bacterium]
MNPFFSTSPARCARPLLVMGLVFLAFCGLSVQAQFKALAADGDIFIVSDGGAKKQLRPGMAVPNGSVIQSGGGGQAILQYGSSFNLTEVRSNAKVRVSGDRVTPAQ